MKNIVGVYMLFIAVMIMAGCNGNKNKQQDVKSDSVVSVTPDTALYGTVGEGTTMHALELVTDGGKNLTFEMDTEEDAVIYGGVFAGDRVTLTFVEEGDVKRVTKLVNLTSLIGKWTSLDRNFQIQESGVVESTGTAESHPYTQWSTTNARLVLNVDTFDIVTLGPDSMSLENDKGIFVYKRQK